MQVEIVQLQQEMDFQTRKTLTFVILKLPNGVRVRAAVDEGVASAIVSVDIEENGAPPVSVLETQQAIELPPDEQEVEVEIETHDYDAPPAPVVLEDTPQQTTREFGGDFQPDAKPAPKKNGANGKGKKKQAAPKPSAPPAEDPAPPPAPKLPEGHVVPQSTQHYKKLIKEGKISPNAFARTVPKDEYGYPVLQAKPGTADPQRVVGQQNQDEDGVGSV